MWLRTVKIFLITYDTIGVNTGTNSSISTQRTITSVKSHANYGVYVITEH